MMYSSFSSAEDAVTFEGDRWPAAFASVCSSPLLAAHRPALLSVGQVGSSHCWLPTPPRSSARHAMGGGAADLLSRCCCSCLVRTQHCCRLAKGADQTSCLRQTTTATACQKNAFAGPRNPFVLDLSARACCGCSACGAAFVLREAPAAPSPPAHPTSRVGCCPTAAPSS